MFHNVKFACRYWCSPELYCRSLQQKSQQPNEDLPKMNQYAKAPTTPRSQSGRIHAFISLIFLKVFVICSVYIQSDVYFLIENLCLPVETSSCWKQSMEHQTYLKWIWNKKINTSKFWERKNVHAAQNIRYCVFWSTCVTEVISFRAKGSITVVPLFVCQLCVCPLFDCFCLFVPCLFVI